MLDEKQAVSILFTLTFLSGLITVVGFYLHNTDISGYGIGASKMFASTLLLALNINKGGSAPPPMNPLIPKQSV